MIIHARNGCRRHNPDQINSGSCGLLQEALEKDRMYAGWTRGSESDDEFNSEAHGSCEVYEECCREEGAENPVGCSPVELGLEEC